MTFSLERLYEAYALGGIDPQDSAVNMDEFYESLVSFAGIEPQEYEHMCNHLKVTKMAPGVGAYASYYGIVAVPDDGWSGSAIKGVGLGWGYPHEFGHILDSVRNVLFEVTNNVFSIKYVLDGDWYPDYVIEKPLSDPNLIESSDTTALWSVDPRGYTGVFMFWDLEVYHEGFNGKLADMLRDQTCGDSTVDAYLQNCSNEEKIVAYTSKILGIDMRYYFKKYGYVTSPSSNCNAAITSMNLSNKQPKIWYYDSDAYKKSRGSNVNISAKPSLFNYETSSKTMYFNVPMEAADDHLGFEIIKDGKFVAYVWDDQYTDSNLSGTYTVNAYDRSLNKYASFTVNTSNASSINQPVAKVGSVNYRTIEDAVNAATDGETVYLLGSSTIRNTVTVNGKSIRLAPADENKRIVIYNGVGSKNVFSLTNGGELTVKTQGDSDNVLIFDSRLKQSRSYFSAVGKSYLEIGKGVTVKNCKSSDPGSVISAIDSTVVLGGCIIERNKTGSKGTIYLSGSELVSGEGTVIRYNNASQSGSAIQADQNNSIEITDTTIYKNTGGSKSQSGTIYLVKSDISVGNGTVIRGNQSDWYNLNSGICVTTDSNAVFSGNIDIPDHVAISKPVQINKNIKGTLNLRPDSAYAAAGNVIAKPVSGSLSFDMTDSVSLEHNLLYLDCQNGQFCLSDTIPLINESSFSGKSFCTGDTLKMYLNAAGGNGKYTYSYQVTKYNGSTVESKYTFTVDAGKTVQEYKFDKKGKYDFEITVKDSSGKTSEIKKQTVNVYNKLVNKSTVSASTITLGNSVSITAAAQGGNGSYKYSVSYKKAADTKWTSVQGYQTSITEKVTPKAVGNYVIRVTVKDTAGNSVYTDYKITVNSKLTNTSKISASSIDLGKTVTVTASAQGGAGNYTYAVLYKKTADTKWTTKQGFNANNSVSVKLANATTYDICAKVKDAQGTIEKKFFKLTVNNGIENKSTLSASTIAPGSSVTVKCSASGGSGYYNYAVYYKKTSDTKWTTKQNFDSNVIVKITPAKATTYDICVKIRDSANRETKKYFKLTVTSSELSNNSKISATSVKVNSSVTVTAAAAGGTSPYKYAF